MLKNRVAVSAFFFVNGFLHANLMARLPELQLFFDVSNSGLGTMLFLTAIGALVAMPITGWLTTKIGSDQLAIYTGILFCFCVPFIPVLPIIWLGSALFFLLGMFLGAVDVAVNGQAVYVERLWKKPIISSFHALFSIGMALGALSGSIFSKFKIDLPIHMTITSAFSLILVIWASFHLIKDQETKKNSSNTESGFRLPSKAILPLGLIAFCCMIGEGSMVDWSAIYMSKVMNASPSQSALAFGIYATGMTIGRLFGDKLTYKLGQRKLLIYEAALTVIGLSIVIGFTSTISALVGFFIVGLGVASIVPIVFSIAGNTKGVNPSVGIAMATTIGYTGFFIGPPSIGYLSDAFGMRVGLGFTLLLFGVMLILILKFMDKSKTQF